jgi:hypothetical protein
MIMGIVHYFYRLSDLVVTLLGYRSRGLGSIPGATRFFWEVVSLERGPFSLVSLIEGLLLIKNSDSGQETEIKAVGNRCSNHATFPLYAKVGTNSPTGGGPSFGIVRSRTKAMELVIIIVDYLRHNFFNSFISNQNYSDSIS